MTRALQFLHGQPNRVFAFASRFILAIDPKNAPPNQLGNEEVAASQGLVSAIDNLVNAKIQDGMRAIVEAQNRRPR
jgi:hypothetical protein